MLEFHVDWGKCSFARLKQIDYLQLWGIFFRLSVKCCPVKQSLLFDCLKLQFGKKVEKYICELIADCVERLTQKLMPMIPT